MTLPNPQKHVVPTVVLTKSKLVPITVARPVTVPKPHVTRPRPAKTIGNPQHALKDKGVIGSGCSRHMIGNMSYLSDFEEINGRYVAFGRNPKGGKISGRNPKGGKISGFMTPFGYPVAILNTLDPLGKFDGKADEGFLVGYSNTDDDVAFEVKEPEFEGKKPEFEVYVSPIKLEDITYSDDVEDVGAEADFTNLETTITVSPIPTTRVYKDHPMTQIIGDLSSSTQTRSMIRVAKDQDEKLSSTPIDTKKPLLKDPDGEDMDVNDVMRLQALVDKKKVIITKATIREALRLDDVESIDCLPNEEIFTELSRMGYEKPSTKFTFYKAFFLPQWKAQVGDLSSHSTKYSSPALTQKVFANMRRIGKGFFRVDTPLFEGIIMAQQADEGVASVDVDAVLAAIDEPFIPSPTPTTQPPPPSQDLPSTSQVLPTLPPSLIVQPPSSQQQLQPPQPSHDVEISMDLLHTLLETYTTLTRRVKHLEQDKIAQTLEITKLKQRVKKLERGNKLKVSKIRRLKKDVAAVAKDVAAVEKSTEIKENADDNEIKPTELNELVEVVTTAKLMIEVATTASATITATTTSLTAATLTTTPSAARRRKGVDEAYARELEAELNMNIDWDEVIKKVQRKEKEDNVMMRYQALMRKPQTEAQARKNMMIYLRNMAGFKMDYFKRMSYDNICQIFKKKFNSNVDFLEKTREQMEEEDIKALKRASESQAEKAAKK
uniref:Ribonuclease H-like domain-containing protein n=1 Tax=Tanacetum cinerariifolium TaxID=118510 RepID=A0A6L2NTR4_TANCI|nr:ribonuclease H-like domain-containing protein [Tanacetum cinerariifolium]